MSVTLPKLTLNDLVAEARRNVAVERAEVQAHRAVLDGMRRRLDTDPTSVSDENVRAAIAAKEVADAKLSSAEQRLEALEAEQRQDDAETQRANQVHMVGVPRRSGSDVAYTVAGQVTQSQPESRQAWVRSNDGREAVVARGERFAEHEIVREQMSRDAAREQSVIGQHGSLGQLVRSMTTTSGSAIVPTVWAGDLIDRARNYAAVLQAGAEIVPMDAKTVQIGRLTGDPTAAFRTEGTPVTASDPTFDNVTLDAKTMSALVVGSLEWFQDATNVDQVVSNAIAQAIGLQLDLVSLYGSITSGAGSISLPTPPNPRGVLGTLNAVAPTSVLGGATNGTTQTAASYWNEVLDAIFTVRDYNEAPNALIWNSKAARQYAKAYDTTGQPLGIPSDVTALARLTSNQIPSYTQGTMASRATDLFVGNWSQLLIGQRLDMTVQTLTERYAENGQVAIIAHWRGDVQLARPRAFSVYRALQGA